MIQTVSNPAPPGLFIIFNPAKPFKFLTEGFHQQELNLKSCETLFQLTKYLHLLSFLFKNRTQAQAQFVLFSLPTLPPCL